MAFKVLHDHTTCPSIPLQPFLLSLSLGVTPPQPPWLPWDSLHCPRTHLQPVLCTWWLLVFAALPSRWEHDSPPLLLVSCPFQKFSKGCPRLENCWGGVGVGVGVGLGRVWNKREKRKEKGCLNLEVLLRSGSSHFTIWLAPHKPWWCRYIHFYRWDNRSAEGLGHNLW